MVLAALSRTCRLARERGQLPAGPAPLDPSSIMQESILKCEGPFTSEPIWVFLAAPIRLVEPLGEVRQGIANHLASPSGQLAPHARSSCRRTRSSPTSPKISSSLYGDPPADAAGGGVRSNGRGEEAFEIVDEVGREGWEINDKQVTASTASVE
jgi:hypothetical protein